MKPKAWFETCMMNFGEPWGDEEYPVKFGINWFKHGKQISKRFKSWNGVTIQVYLLKYQISFNFVDDREAYNFRMNYRNSDYLKEKIDLNKSKNDN
jgi:hypothetical protein